MFALSSQPKSIHDILVDSGHLYKSSLLKVLLLSVVAMFILSLPKLLFDSTIKVNSTSWTALPTMTSIYQSIDWFAFSIISVCSLLGSWFILIMLYRINQLSLQSQEGYKTACAVVTKKFFLCVIAETISIILIILGLSLLILPGIYINILFLFVSFYILFENNSVFQAFKHSIQLTQPYWWRTFALFFIMLISFVIATWLLSEAVNTLTITVLQVFLHQGSETQIILYYASLIVPFLIAVFMVPWFVAVLVLQYHDLKLRRQIRLQ